MLDDQLEDVDELAAGVAVLDDDLLGPVGEHGVAVLHAARHAGRQDLQGLTHHAARLHRVGLQQRVEHLEGSGCGSMTFWWRSGSGDPCLLLMDPDSDRKIRIRIHTSD